MKTTKEDIKKEMSKDPRFKKEKKQGSGGRAKLVFGRPARGMVKGYV
jgi:hypothetical protein